MRTRVFASILVFLMVTMVSAPWLQSESDQGVPHFNQGAPSAGTELAPILNKDQLWGSNAQFPYQTHAYELAAKIHNRMPLILDGQNAVAWLSPASQPEVLGGLLTPYPADAMECFPVSMVVNSPRNIGPQCVTPIADVSPVKESNKNV